MQLVLFFLSIVGVALYMSRQGNDAPLKRIEGELAKLPLDDMQREFGNALQAPQPATDAGQAEPGSVESIKALVRRIAAEEGLDPSLMLAMVEQESSFDPRAVNPNDPSYGLGQIQTFWMRELYRMAEDRNAMFDPAFNLHLMADVLKYFMRRPLSSRAVDRNRRAYRSFSFPEEADIYNIGETNFRAGRRNLVYRDGVARRFAKFRQEG